jgi:hypothetical protein
MFIIVHENKDWKRMPSGCFSLSSSFSSSSSSAKFVDVVKFLLVLLFRSGRGSGETKSTSSVNRSIVPPFAKARAKAAQEANKSNANTNARITLRSLSLSEAVFDLRVTHDCDEYYTNM